MSDKETKTRERKVTVTDEMLKSYREIGSETPSPMATLLRTLPDAEAKKQIQRIENAVEKNSKDRLASDEGYQSARKLFEAAKNTFYRTRNKLTVEDVSIENPDFDSDQPVSEENPAKIIIKRNGFESRRAALREKIAEEDAKEASAAAETATGENFDPKQEISETNMPEGVLHKNMREAQERKRALARKAMGLNGTDQETPPEVLTDGE